MEKEYTMWKRDAHVSHLPGRICSVIGVILAFYSWLYTPPSWNIFIEKWSTVFGKDNTAYKIQYISHSKRYSIRLQKGNIRSSERDYYTILIKGMKPLSPNINVLISPYISVRRLYTSFHRSHSPQTGLFAV